jgi:hypothetical protein
MQLGGDDYGKVVKAIKGDVLSLVRAFVPLCCGGRGVGRATKLRSVDRRSALRRKGAGCFDQQISTSRRKRYEYLIGAPSCRFMFHKASLIIRGDSRVLQEFLTVLPALQEGKQRLAKVSLYSF